MLKNPVALSFDNQGRLFVVETARRGTVDVDIRSHKDWVIDDLSSQTIGDIRRLFRTKMAPALSEQNKPWLQDRNQDGSHDWRDLTTVKERIHLLQDTNDDGKADVAKVYAEGFNQEINGVIAGVLPYRGDVFATIYPDVWKLNDVDGDGYADKQEVFFHGFGVHAAFDGHDLHGLTVGPDGKLYFSVGDNGFSVRTREGKLLHHPNTGGVLRCDWDGSHLEVFAFGLRNVQELAFDDYGNLFSVDNDGDIREERERFVYITEGSDSGWRLNWQFKKGGWPDRTKTPQYCPWIDEKLWLPHWKGQAAYITPPMSEFSVGPGGFKYNPGTALNNRYKGYFFLCEFPVQKITAFTTKPRGAYFEMLDEHIFLFGMMASAINFGPDGSMYIADWDGKWQPNELGSIWAVDDPALRKSKTRLEVTRLLHDGFGSRTVPSLLKLLGHADQRIRLEAQFELARRNKFDELLDAATDTNVQLLARVHALWGLGQLTIGDGQSKRLGKQLPFGDANFEIRAQAAKLAGTLKIRPAAGSLVELLKDNNARVQFHTAMSLGHAGSRSTVAALLTLLERNDDRDAYIRHAAIMGLVGSASASQLAQNVTNPSSAVRAASVVALRRLKHPSAAVFLNDTDERVQRETVSAIHDDTSIPGALAEVANLLPSNTSHDEAITRRLLSANLRVGKRVNAQHLVDYALNESKSLAMRKEALLCLGDWNRHPFVDRVEGRVRKLSIRNKDLPKRLVAKNLEKLYQTAGSDLLPVLIQLTEKLGIGPDINQLFAIANSTSQSRLARVQAIRSMQAKRPGVIANRLVDLLKTNQPEIQIAVIDKIASSEPEWLGPRLDEKWELLSLRATQHFLHTLGKAASPVGDRILRQSFDALLNGKLTRELELDIITAAKARMTPPLVKLLEKHKATQTPDDTLAPYRPSLVGGDAAMGRLVYEQHVAGQCVRCHDAGGEKNQVGPVLKGIGKRFNREYLLRSLVEPSANIAEGFDVTIAETSDGQTFVGRTQKQTVKTISLVLVDGKLMELKATSIKNLTNTKASAMPPMGAILSPHETRDLVAYLSTL
tara:strand:+ start:206 stop:3394 length:3189 start_codon:yes stop_codon:yes gene_type:complete